MKAKKFGVILVCLLAALFLAACHEHNYNTYEINVAPTETAKGTAVGTCSCGSSTEIELPALSDTTVWELINTVDPTCTEKGSKTYTSKYGNVVVEITAKGHEHTEYTITTNPTETTKGSATVKCSCGNEVTKELPALSDTETWFVKSTTDATCTEQGTTVYTSIYGDVTITTAALDHSWGEWTVATAPTISTEGKIIRGCSNDANHTESFTLPALNTTDYAYSKVDSKCGVAGKETYVYTKDSKEFTFEVEIAALSHTYGEWSEVSAPTLEQSGSLTRTCGRDASHTETFTLPALNKVDYTYTYTSPVCGEKDGVEVYTMEKDGQKFEYTIVVPKNDHLHNKFEMINEPTLTEAGTAKAKCECGHEIEVAVAALSDATVWKVTETVDATCTKEGSRTYSSIYGEVVTSVAKLVAPYDNKSYVALNFEAVDELGAYVNNVITPEDVWGIQVLTIDANGRGIGNGYPFRGYFEITMVNPTTGEILVTKYEAVDTDGDSKLDTPDFNSTPVKSKAFVDFATGIIMCETEQMAEYNMWSPLEDVTVGIDATQATASGWDNAMAITYTDLEGKAHNIFMYNGVVYFGVEFTDLDGQELLAESCYNATITYVNDSEGNKIAGFAFNGEKLVVADGYEGTYTNGSDELVVTGAGIAYLNGYEARYVIAPEGSAFTAGAYAAGNYYETTLDTINKTFTMVMPEVEINFVSSEEEVAAGSANINVPYDLPELGSTLTHTFKGWFYDEACTQPVEEVFIPTKPTTLYASWKAKVVIILVGVAEGDTDTLYLGEGDIIGDYLPEYNLDNVNMRKFDGWYLDEIFENSLPEDAAVTSEDTGITIYAKWVDLPAYIGTYKGTELYNAGYGNYGGKTLTIDENGNMTGLKNGVIISYDPETQVVEWKTTAESADVNKFYFNATLGIIAGLYNNSNIANDFYIFSRTDEDGKANASYGIKTQKSPTDATRGWYAHLVNITTDLGDVEIFLYNNYIYDTFTATDAAGNELTAATVKQSKTLIVKDGEENTIVSVASTGNSFADQANTVDLDPYFGSYANGEDTITLDGVGTITFGEKTGTYALANEGSSYQFDVYLNDNTEYYELTLNGESFTLVKAMVNITYVEGEYASIEDEQANKNVAFTLPELTHATNVFNGWFYDEACTQPVSEFIPTKDTTLYALWKVKVTLTLNKNNGEENQIIEYSEGDSIEVVFPLKDGFAFAGWYTSPTFEEETLWGGEIDPASGKITTTISEDVVVYAKYVDAPVYTGSYASVDISGTTSNGNVNSFYARNAAITVDPYGNGPKGSSWPFASGTISVKNYNSETGYLEIHVGTSNVYKGFIDPVTKFIVLSDTNNSTSLQEVVVMNPYDEKNTSTMWTGSYWNSGNTRLITYTTTGFNMFIINDTVYFGVTVENANGEAITTTDAHTSESVVVKDSEGNVIAKFAHNGETLKEMDGNEGTYTNGLDTLVVDGVVTVTLNGTKGTYAKSQEGAEYDLDVYVADSYYEVTLNKTEGTYTINKPYVEIVFETYGKAEVETLSTNKNIQITLSEPTNAEFVFRGWYLENTFTNVVDIEYLPTKSLTLYAKWDAKVTLTVVYGNGLEDVVLNYASGDTVAPAEPALTNGKVFNGWYCDSELTVEYVLGEITENTTIYCSWKDAIALFGSYKGFEVWGSSANGSTTSGGSSSKTLNVDASGNVTGEHTGTISEYNPETGTFKLVNGSSYRYGFFDAENGVLAYAYTSNKETLGNDIYIYIRDVEKAVTGSAAASYWNKGLSRLMTVTLTGHEKATVNLFLNEDVIYYDVTFEATGVVSLGAQDAYKQNDLRVYDSTGELIAEYMKKDGGLVVKALDGYQGTYTIGEDTLVLDGYGAGTLNGEAVTYSYSGTTFTVSGESISEVYIYNEETNTFTESSMDVFAGKTLKGTHECPVWSYYDTHTVSFKFDGMGTVNITYTCTDYSCSSYTSFTGDATYTIEGSTMTITKGSDNMVFTVNGTTLTLVSTTLTSDDPVYLSAGTSVK